jgi:hypothetical protein
MHVADVVGASYAAFAPVAAAQQGEAYVAPQLMHVTHRTGKRLHHAITECMKYNKYFHMRIFSTLWC